MKMNKSKNLIYFAAILLVLSFVGCATLGLTNPKQQYLIARQQYNDTVEQYLNLYGLSDEATQAEWKKVYHPVFKSGFSALDGWGLAIDSNKDPAAERKKFENIRKDAIAILLKLTSK